MGLIQGESIAARCFLNVLGASRLDCMICAAAGVAGLKYTYGASLGMHVEFFEESELILIWGSNPIASSLHFGTRVQEAKRRGAKLIAIDPYKVADGGEVSSAHRAAARHGCSVGARHDSRADPRKSDRP